MLSEQLSNTEGKERLQGKVHDLFLRLETQDKNIRVSAIYPGATWTRSWSESGIDEDRLMPAEDIAQLVFECHNTSSRSVVEDIIIRPQLGDI